jgi:hypothetical protein
LENLEEITEFLDTYELPKLNQDDINNINRSIASNEHEAIIKSLLTKKSLGLDEFTVDFYKTFEELTAMLLKL